MEYFDLENPLTSFNEHQPDTLPSLFADESLHMPSLNVNHLPFPSLASFRQDAISLISQVQFSYNLDPSIPYLAVNYLDRFISTRQISVKLRPRWIVYDIFQYILGVIQQEKPWIIRLLVLSCLSLAAKMKITDLPISSLQGDDGCIYDARSINRMEVLILTTLNWRMRSITPFSFLNLFISLLNLEDPCLVESIKNRASIILFKSQSEIKLLEHKPSIVAACAILCASNEMFPSLYHPFKTAISSCKQVNKGSLEGCLSVMKEIAGIDAASTSTRRTPISVLECQCTTSESEINKVPEGEDNIKRRKLQ